MADRHCKIQFDLHETRYFGVFWVADFEFEVKFEKFKLTDPIRRTAIAKHDLIYIKLGIWKFFGSLFSNQESNFKSSKWPIQYRGLKSQNITWFVWNPESGSFLGRWFQIKKKKLSCIEQLPSPYNFISHREINIHINIYHNYSHNFNVKQ